MYIYTYIYRLYALLIDHNVFTAIDFIAQHQFLSKHQKQIFQIESQTKRSIIKTYLSC